MKQMYGLCIVIISLLSLLGCSTIEAKHQPQFSKNDWTDDLTPFNPTGANEWSTIDLGKPKVGESIFRYDPESPLQDILDIL